MNSAEQYNKVKDICLSIYNKYGIDDALKMLGNYRTTLPYKAWIGLKAELIFYDRYFDEFHLEQANDHGINADFIGYIDGNIFRIDVTTNIECKKFETYEPIISRSQRKYKIAIMNPENFEFMGFCDLNFPPDMSREGRWFDIAVFMPADYNRHGECRYNYYQKIIRIGSSNPEEDFSEQEICTDWYLPDIATYVEELNDAFDDDTDIEFELIDYLSKAAQLLSKSTGKNIVACGCCHKYYIDPRNCEDEFTNIKLLWIHPVVKNYLPEYIEVDVSDY